MSIDLHNPSPDVIETVANAIDEAIGWIPELDEVARVAIVALAPFVEPVPPPDLDLTIAVHKAMQDAPKGPAAQAMAAIDAVRAWDRRYQIDPAALHETVEGMVRQFALTTVRNGVPCLTAGGLSALEAAFDALGWDDPYPCPEQACEQAGCPEWATCGTPTPEGYKRLCGTHYLAIAAASQDGGS